MPTPKPKSKFIPSKKPGMFQSSGAPKPAEPVPPPVFRRGMQPIQLLRGMRDILPSDQWYWNEIEKSVERLADAYGFHRIETPILEETSLFIRGVGKMTDIVEKELYSFETQGGEQVSLRPEYTAPIVRSFIQHGMWNLPQPVKLWCSGPMFRYDRPQAGRFRQFNQAGFECIGEADPVIDAQLVIVAWQILKGLGIETTIHINSIGTPESRVAYKNALVAYFRTKRSRLSEEDKKRLLKNPLRLLDSKEPGMQELKAEAPQMVDWLDEDSKAHFMRVLEYLDEVGAPYQLDPYLVRGLDYYTRTVFELFAVTDDPELAQTALGGGGRYDGLVELLGGRPTPAAGFALGMDRIVSRLKDRQPVPPASLEQRDVFLAQLGEMGRKKALALFEEFRVAGIKVGEALAKSSIKAQMEIANKQAAKWAIIIGQKEVLDGTAIIRDMDAGTQEIVDAKKIIHEVKKKMGMATHE